jgi:hypothetical protein
VKSHRLSLAAFALLLSAGPALAGAPVSENREIELPKVCAGGREQGQVCESAEDCPGGRCRIVFLHGKPPPIRVTLLVDDDVSSFEGDENLANVVAVTVLLEARRGHERRIFSQTYQNLDASSLESLIEGLTSGVPIADLASRDRVLTENALNTAIADGGILDDFLFQGGDSELADAIRAFYGVAGRPVVVKITSGDSVVHTDEEAGPLASAVQLLLSIRFVPES